MKPRSQQASGHEQELHGTAARGASPDGSDGIAGPGLGIGEGLLLSRSGFSNPRGKLSSELPKVRVTDETLAMLQLRAAEHGIPLSELIRVVLECLVFGTNEVANSQADRVRRVGALLGANASQEGQ